MCVGVEVDVGSAIGVGVEVGDGVGVGVGVAVGSGVSVGVEVEVEVTVGVGSGVRVGVAEGVGVEVGVRVAVGTGVAVGARVAVTATMGAGVGVGKGVGGASLQATSTINAETHAASAVNPVRECRILESIKTRYHISTARLPVSVVFSRRNRGPHLASGCCPQPRHSDEIEALSTSSLRCHA